MTGSEAIMGIAKKEVGSGAPLKIVQITPGTGHFFCGSCLRDEMLVRALRARGHDVMMLPVYLPFVLESEAPPLVSGDAPVFLGGVNVFLQHKVKLWKLLPRWMRSWLDQPGFLRWAAARGAMTEAKDLGELTVAMLRGERGPQEEGLGQLLTWLREHERPDVLILSNAMLSGLAGRLRAELDRPILCTLQGEAPFLDALVDPHRAAAWSEMAARARDVDHWIAVSRFTGALMRERLALEEHRVSVVHNGIVIEGIASSTRPSPPQIGYLARMCPDKGLHTLVDAFIALRHEHPALGARLHVAGVQLAEDRAYVKEQQRKLRDAGLEADVEWLPNCTREEKLRFLSSLSVLSVPAIYGESFGLYLVEAWAAGVPVVQPRHGAFPELIAHSGGGLLCEPGDASSLAEQLARILNDEALGRRLGAAGQKAAREYFSIERVACDIEAVCRRITAERSAREPVR
ncbi:MAG: glycosyltransferase family 4 protein [Planctomycetota bacterium]